MEKAFEENNAVGVEREKAEKKIEALKKDIADLGYKIEETPEGEIKISE